MKGQHQQFALAMIAYSALRGMDTKELFRLAGIEEKTAMNKNAVITEKQLNELWKCAIHLSGDSFFGLHFGESLQLAGVGVAGEIIKASNTLGEALTIGVSLIPTITSMFTMSVRRGRKSFNVVLQSTNKSNNPLATQVADLLMVFTVHELNGLLLKKVVPLSVSCPHARPNLSEYQRVFRCDNIRTSSPYSLEFSNDLWDTPLISANFELQTLFLKQLSANPGQGTKTKNTFPSIVHDFLLKNSYLGILSIEDVSRNFNMTSRSLQRKLQAEDTTFQKIVNDVRKSLAVNYISAGSHPIKEISTLMGYNEISAFSRAFKRWTGRAPIEFQRPKTSNN